LKIIIEDKSFTDNSKQASKETIFVTSKQNEQFLDEVRKSDYKDIINSSELKNYFDFSSIKIVGITGTNGKTTTAAAIYSILLDLGYKVALQGTRGFFINDKKVQEYSLTTPVQLENFANIYEAIQNSCEYFIMEVSSHAIEQNRIKGLDFALKIHTNITQDHLDYHKSLQNYIDIKNSFFNDNSVKLINKDDKNIKFKLKNIYAYGMENPATYKVVAYSVKNGLHVALQHFSNIVNFSSSLIGLFNIYNLTAAIAAVNILTKEPLAKICEVVEYFGGVNGRMEIVCKEPLIIVDFAHTPDGIEKVLNNFLDYDIITVFGAGGDRDKTKRPLMGRVVQKYSKEIVITSDNPRFEDPDLICSDILKGINNMENVTIELNRKDAISKAIKKGSKYKNPVILVLGKGDEEYQIIYDKKIPFNDKLVIEKLT
jgi:UDP-N-acetylmuramoyl-L-alanyl-D-glutamate--2,6-diaminopimelate ligase